MDSNSALIDFMLKNEIPHVYKRIFDDLDCDGLLSVNQGFRGKESKIVIKRLVEYLVDFRLRRLKLNEWIELYFKAELGRNDNDVHKNVLKLMNARLKPLFRRLTKLGLANFRRAVLINNKLREAVDAFVIQRLLRQGNVHTMNGVSRTGEREFMQEFHQALGDHCHHLVYIMEDDPHIMDDDPDFPAVDVLRIREINVYLNWHRLVWNSPGGGNRTVTIRSDNNTVSFSGLLIYPIQYPGVTEINLDCTLANELTMWTDWLQRDRLQGLTIRYNAQKIPQELLNFFITNANHPSVGRFEAL